MKAFWKKAEVLALAFGAGAVLVVTFATDSEAAQKPPRGTIILMRGLANVFSLGLDDLNDQLHAHGVTNSVVTSYSGWSDIANQITADYRRDRAKAAPIILMGHSFGADATLEIADELAARNVPVALIINFDAVTETVVPKNVGHVINFYESKDNGLALKPGEGFKGKLENIDAVKIDPEIGHLNIEKSQRLHTRAIQAVLSLLNRSS
jgi:hypothetical protein